MIKILGSNRLLALLTYPGRIYLRPGSLFALTQEQFFGILVWL
jgi:hypothetical protein